VPLPAWKLLAWPLLLKVTLLQCTNTAPPLYCSATALPPCAVLGQEEVNLQRLGVEGLTCSSCTGTGKRQRAPS
jgi:hypothetical protein